jgi:PAS domain S-box-containing protein
MPIYRQGENELKTPDNVAACSATEWLTMAGGDRVVSLAAGVTLAGTLIYVFLLPSLTGLDDYRLLGPAFLIPVSIASLLLVWQRKACVAYLVLLLGVLLGVTVAALIVAGLRTGIVFVYPAVIVAAMALGPQWVRIFGMATIAAVIGIGLAEHFALLPAPRLSPTYILGLAYTLVLLVLTIVASAMVREQQRWRDKAAEATRALEKSLHALAERERDLRQVMNNVPAGICAFDGWVCRFANSHLAAYCGFSEEEIVGRHLREVLGETHFALARPHVEQALAGKPVHYRGPHPSPAFAGRYMMFVLVPTAREPGGEAGFYGIFFDVTRHERARLEVEQLNRDLDQRVKDRTNDLATTNRELESFAYSISHDLRAPLRGIDGFSHLLAEEYAERLDETGRGYLERVRAAAQRMGHLIDDILELSRVSRQAMRQERVDLSRLAAELMDEIRQDDLLRKTDVSISPDCAAQGDPRLLRVLMQNLLENAWKYTARQASARIAFGTEALDTGETAYFVRDNGVGFDMKYADRLFSPFQRLHSPEAYPGSGIGLATVARIVHRHGGRVWAESAPGQGTTLRFTLGSRGAF